MPTHDQIRRMILESWRTGEPAVFRRQPRGWLEEEADARASLAESEMDSMLPPMSRAEAWSEVARFFLGRCPEKRDGD